MSEITVISAFSGIGAYEKALYRLGIIHKILNYIEINKYASKAYSVLHNVNEEKNLGDITKINPDELDDFDLFVYSPPCQSWSAAGKQEGFKDPRGILFFDALRIIQTKKPKYAVMENVKGLTQKKFRYEFETMLKLLEQEGYKNYWKVLNAKDYGVPQNRERVFVISIREDIDIQFEFPAPVPLRIKLEDVLEKDVQLPILHNIYGGFKETRARVFTQYSPTIRTAAGGGHIPSVVVKESNSVNMVNNHYKIIDGYIVRQLTPLEVWRLMGYNDKDYELVRKTLNSTFYKGKDRSRTQLYNLAGNSIVVDVLMHIFAALFKNIKQKRKNYSLDL